MMRKLGKAVNGYKTQWPKEKGQYDKQRSAKHTKDGVLTKLK
jgi:hypothetical protein